MTSEYSNTPPHNYHSKQVSKMIFCSLLISLGLQQTTDAGAETTPPQLGLLHLVGPVTVSTTQLLQQVSLTVPSTHDMSDYSTILQDIKTLTDKILTIPALENTTVFYKSAGPVLTEIANDITVIENYLAIMTTYKDKTIEKLLTSNCDIFWKNLRPATLTAVSKGLIVATTNTKWKATVAEMTAAPSDYHQLQETLTKVQELLNDYAILITDRVKLLESLLNKQIGEELLTAISSRDCIKPASFESTKIIACYKHSRGISCTVEITALTEQQIYQQYTPINYRGIQITASDPDDYFVKTSDNKWGLLSCTKDDDQLLDLFDYCYLSSYDNDCSKILMTKTYSDYSSNCNFTKHTPKVYTKTTTGLLIQGEGLLIKLRDPVTNDLNKIIDKDVPLLIQTNNIVEIGKDGSTTLIKPTEQYTEEYIIDSWMTNTDLDNLELKTAVLEILDDISYGEYIDIALIILMGIIIPIIGILLKNRPISTWNQNSEEKHRRKTSKHNLKQNREMSKMLH